LKVDKVNGDKPPNVRSGSKTEGPSHSITSSALESIIAGTCRLNSLAVLKIDDQLELGEELYRQVGGLRALNIPRSN
jgi:hypothetical protein